MQKLALKRKLIWWTLSSALCCAHEYCFIEWYKMSWGYYFFLFFFISTLLLVENLDFLFPYLFYRTQEKLPMPSGNCLWRRPRGIWRMLWPINRPFPSHDSAVVLDVLLRQRTGIQMDKDDGLSNQQSSFLTCSRMLRVMLRYVSYVCLRIVAVYVISVGK